MYHGATFLDMRTDGGMKTFENWHLVPKKRLYIDPPEVKMNMIDIPGGDGYLDATEAPDGRVHYGMRTASWEFHVQREYRSFYHYLFSSIMNYCHGQNMRIILDDDPQYFYIGRISVNQFLSEEIDATIVLDVTAQPYKYEIALSTEEWLWDPFNFETDYVRGYGGLTVDGERTLEIPGSKKPIAATFTVTLEDPEKPITLIYRGAAYRLDQGTYKMTNVVIFYGINTLVFQGHGTVSVEFRGASL